MNTINSGIRQLLRAAITGKAYALPEEFSLSEIRKLARKHQCETLCYYGALYCGVSKDDPVMQSLYKHMLLHYAVNENQQYEIGQIFSAFEAQHIDYLPLKGAVLKSYYPKTDMRTMSDIDVLIHVEQMPVIEQILTALGYEFHQESAHEIIYKKTQINLELHKSLIPSYHEDMYKFFGNGWDMAQKETADSCRYVMTPEHTYLYLFSHFSKHFQDGGIGIRHMTDLWIWRQNHPDMDNAVIDKGLETLELTEFHQNIMQTLQTWFADAAPTELTDFITKFIISSGSFGQRENRRLSTASVNAPNAKNARQIKGQSVRTLIFPKKQLLINDYPILKKHGWLLPAVWILRAFKAVFIKGSVPMQRRRLKEISPASIKDYQQKLAYVGLHTKYEGKL